jgi:cobalt-zinc-cadmium resistance protein CzcA
MFHPMAMTVIFALIAAFILSLTFVPAMVAMCITGKVTEKDMFLVRWAKADLRAGGPLAVKLRYAVVVGCGGRVRRLARCCSHGWAGVRPHARREGHRDARDAHPSTGITQSQAMQYDVERAVSKFPEVAFVYSKTGTAELATDPMPPNVSDTFIIFKDKSQWRSEAELDRLIAEKTEEMEKMGSHGDGGRARARRKRPRRCTPTEAARSRAQGQADQAARADLQTVPGNNYEFTQPIQMRFNELISGVRGDVAVKVYGDDFASMQDRRKRCSRRSRESPGAADAKVEQTEGLPVMTVEPDRAASPATA